MIIYTVMSHYSKMQGANHNMDGASETVQAANTTLDNVVTWGGLIMIVILFVGFMMWANKRP